MPKLDLTSIPQTNATGYPAPFDAPVQGRNYRRLAPATGMERLRASHVVLEPGAWSSQRHWHREIDELLVMISGEAVLVEDDGESVVQAGDIVAWPAGKENGHHLQNRTDEPCVFVVAAAGQYDTDGGEYPDIDMVFEPDGYFRKDGTKYETDRIP
ncbi:cupin domain-containing protein [Erythrobacter sp. SCSIO 43205]|uniref:cupin domain-containing protein n=1 Tax=Erythrobacter sp. SCSIO 43205 TaxID=2779361 RepID=UPI001CA7C2A6|nr:cupin domain-containing protein [Erythrobacter sp. SCSIO 43205]UAB78194.1 cupin domain-containing protein [Erythrobacter sp. SCSIO 43205]